MSAATTGNDFLYDSLCLGRSFVLQGEFVRESREMPKQHVQLLLCVLLLEIVQKALSLKSTIELQSRQKQ